MKKIIYLILSIILFNLFNACAGYKPIYTSNVEFKIEDYSIKSNKKIGQQIYSKLFNLSKSNTSNENVKGISITIDTKKDKSATAKDSGGNVLEYRIALTTKIIIKDYLLDNEMLNQNFSYSSAYKVQDQYSETKKIENQIIQDLIDTTYQNLLIRMSEIILVK